MLAIGGTCAAFWSAGRPKGRTVRRQEEVLERIAVDTSKGSMPSTSNTEEVQTSNLKRQTSESLGLRSDNVCPICRGAGYLVKNVPPGHPDFGKLFPCQCKIEELEAKVRRQRREIEELEEANRRLKARI